MKLKKLLLPVATIASTVAVVTPIITSCGNGESVNAQKLFDGEFKRSENTVLAEDSWTVPEATKNYLTAVKENTKILSEDGFEFISTMINSLYEEHKIRFANVKGSLEFEPSNIIIDETQATPIYKASVKINGDLNISDIKLPESGEGQDILHDAKISINGSIELKNIRIRVGKAADFAAGLKYVWGMCFDYQDMELEQFLNEDWLIKTNLKLSASNLIGFSGSTGLNVQINKDSDLTIVKSIRSLFDGISKYPDFGLGSLKNISIEEDPE